MINCDQSYCASSHSVKSFHSVPRLNLLQWSLITTTIHLSPAANLEIHNPSDKTHATAHRIQCPLSKVSSICVTDYNKNNIFQAFMHLIEVCQCFHFLVCLAMEFNFESKHKEPCFFHLGQQLLMQATCFSGLQHDAQFSIYLHHSYDLIDFKQPCCCGGSSLMHAVTAPDQQCGTSSKHQWTG